MKRFALGLILVLGVSSLALAGAKTGDISVDSQVGQVTTVAVGQNVTAKTNVHSVDVKDGARTGDITIKGKAGSVTNVAAGRNTKGEVNVGSVRAGGK